MINNIRTIENAWNMLQYLYSELKSRRFKNIDISNIETLDNLIALIICNWCTSISKQGLYKEYVEQENIEMSYPQGQINIQESISSQSLHRGTLICSYDELSADVSINNILKSTLQYLIYNENIDKLVKLEINKTMQMFNGVKCLNVRDIHWKEIKFNNSNNNYRHLIEMCKTLIHEHELEKTIGFDDNKRLYFLFKKQAIKWFNIEYGDSCDISILNMEFTIDNESPIEIKLNEKQKIISLKTKEKALLVCIRLQDEGLLEDVTLSKKHMNELVGYCREYKAYYKVTTCGCLVYVNTNKNKLNLQPITVNNINGYMIGETIIDIHDQWRFIENKLRDIYRYFLTKK